MTGAKKRAAPTPKATAKATAPRATAPRATPRAAARAAPVRTPSDAAPRRLDRAAPAPARARAVVGRVTPAAPDAATGRKGQVTAGPAGRAPRAPRAPRPAPPPVERLVAAAVASLEADKGEAIVVLDVADRSAFADRMVIATGLADRQIQAMAQHLEDALEAEGLRRVRIEGLGSSDWVLIDAGDLVVHLFRPEARATYGLERMWGAGSPPPEGGDAGDRAFGPDGAPPALGGADATPIGDDEELPDAQPGAPVRPAAPAGETGIGDDDGDWDDDAP